MKEKKSEFQKFHPLFVVVVSVLFYFLTDLFACEAMHNTRKVKSKIRHKRFHLDCLKQQTRSDAFFFFLKRQ